MSAFARRRPATRFSGKAAAAQRLAAAKAARRRLPPSSDLINAVLECADLRDDLGGGRVMLRLSPLALSEPRLRQRLGDEVERAGDVAVVWDEREDEIFRVFDGGAPPLALVSVEEEPAPHEAEPDEPAYDLDAEDEPQFVLTPAALEYIAASASRRRW
jgi:hypothetical protein